MDTILKLFKSVLIDKKDNSKPVNNYYSETIPCGFILSNDVINNVKNPMHVIESYTNNFVLSGKQLNSCFHKSWEKVKNSSDEQLFIEQVMHYTTTYGFKELGCYGKDTIYIPNEKLEVPSITEGFKLTVINGITKEELKDRILNLVNSGIALKEDTIKDIIECSKLIELSSIEIEQIVNKEVKVRLFDELGKVPNNSVEFLRYVIYKTTGSSLLIKNEDLINKIKVSTTCATADLFKKYKNKQKLAEIFYRYKPLFLAFRNTIELKTSINKIRSLAKKHHKPMPEDFILSLINSIKNGKGINLVKLTKELNKLNVWRKIRLLYAVNFELVECDKVLYKIRNGKSWVKDRKQASKNSLEMFEQLKTLLLESISQNLKTKLEGKTILIPDNIKYTLPSTEKQFTGNFPTGTYVEAEHDLIAGIYWSNCKNYTVDLDLSALSIGGKIGWNTSYRNSNRTLMYSGDVTDAPKGASELLYCESNINEPHIMIVNYYNYSEHCPVDFKIITGTKDNNKYQKNYMLNPNNVFAVTPSLIDKQSKMLGIFIPQKDKLRFHFCETYLGKSNVSSNDYNTAGALKYLFNYYSNMVLLEDILIKAGVNIVRTREDVKPLNDVSSLDVEDGKVILKNSIEEEVKTLEIDIDLSPENLEKDTIINLLN